MATMWRRLLCRLGFHARGSFIRWGESYPYSETADALFKCAYCPHVEWHRIPDP